MIRSLLGVRVSKEPPTASEQMAITTGTIEKVREVAYLDIFLKKIDRIPCRMLYY